MTEGEHDVLAGARKAASVIVLRDAAGGGVEVLMMRRPERDQDFRSGAAVFPGGALDARDALAHPHVVGWDAVRANARMGLDSGALDYLVAAVRECFEEVGLLFADPLDDNRLQVAAQGWRDHLHGGRRTLADLCTELDVRLDLRDWHYWSHWLTPPGHPKRFDTRFFVARAPAGQTAQADLTEAVELLWLTPAQALDRAQGLKLLPVTRSTLQGLTSFADVQSVFDRAAALRDIPMTMPRRALDAHGQLRVLLPSEPPYAEVGRLDPAGRSGACCEIVPGRAVRLSPRVVRVTAPNAGMMTGPGTNTYLVGDPQTGHWHVIDPGPADAQHLQDVVAAAPGPIAGILVTHTHIDHSPGAAELSARTGVPVFGRLALHPVGQDAGFQPLRELLHGERLALGPSTTLQVVHTPGHASNHLCYLLVEERTLFTGDHVMQGSTVVINPPDGDMAAYLKALHALLDLDLDWLAPGHGFLVAQPHQVIRALIRHRLGREEKVVRALRSMQPAPVEALVPLAYADTPAHLHRLATRSLLAHLGKLAQEERAACADGLWSLVVT
jgi:glyoxylase-like metal-dependent hydrolase (beta-lactamase superfamily II)/8-oxo-dGTP pyrophosphatase MutT (NUDIX family)